MPVTPTRTQIENADKKLEPLTQAVWLSLIKQSSYYASNLTSFANLAGVLAAASATLKGQQLNAALDLIEALPQLDAEIEGDEDGISLSIADQRAKLVNYGISILFDVPVNAFGIGGSNQRRYSGSFQSISTF